MVTEMVYEKDNNRFHLNLDQLIPAEPTFWPISGGNQAPRLVESVSTRPAP